MLVWTRCGSSPRMWGTPGFHHDVNVPPRFIPTHVGNTHFLYLSITSIPVHPPACGEHSLCPQESLYICGSSPRMWGTPHALSYPLGRRRFIPTHVGNTSPRRPSTSRIPVHPHACGEHSSASRRSSTFTGSSPRMWGTPPGKIKGPVEGRFIPTHVGNTRPRATTDATMHGSSPRMWGTHFRNISVISATRFIPTHVGNTRPARADRFPGTVHPHACGEHGPGKFGRLWWYGSSPRMWGTPRYSVPPGALSRFIPTHVGNTTGTAPASVVDAVHPHACGEHTYRTALFLKKKKHLEKSTASSSIPWSDPEAGMPPIAARRTTLDVDG